jgi:hypothetical protein
MARTLCTYKLLQRSPFESNPIQSQKSSRKRVDIQLLQEVSTFSRHRTYCLRFYSLNDRPQGAMRVHSGHLDRLRERCGLRWAEEVTKGGGPRRERSVRFSTLPSNPPGDCEDGDRGRQAHGARTQPRDRQQDYFREHPLIELKALKNHQGWRPPTVSSSLSSLFRSRLGLWD